MEAGRVAKQTARSGRVGRPPSNSTRGSTNLTQDEIVDAALKIIADVGVDKLSMRRLSEELGVSPMASYHYVSGKDALLDVVARTALADVRIPDRFEGRWYERLRMIVDQVETRLHSYPGIGEVILDQVLRGQTRIVDGVMATLYEAGFGDADVLAGYSMIHSYLFGRNRASRQDLEVPRERELPPRISRAIEALDSMRGHDFYEFGIDTLILGLRARADALDHRPAD
ncbi:MULTISPECIES: TetR family transcriptional regulator [unclassified Gordonia (in: high G+C Gram-positive bacteria)]